MATLDERLERLSQMGALARTLVAQIDTGQAAETDAEADAAIDAACDLAAHLLRAAGPRMPSMP